MTKTTLRSGETLKLEGQANVEAAATAVGYIARPLVKQAIEKLIYGCESTLGRDWFTAEDVRNLLADNDRAMQELDDRPNLLPALMGKLRYDNRVRAGATVTASRRAGRGHMMRQWHPRVSLRRAS